MVERSRNGQHDAGVSRRTLMNAAAWSVPVVAAVVAVPAHAASATGTWMLVDPIGRYESSQLRFTAGLQRTDGGQITTSGTVTFTTDTGLESFATYGPSALIPYPLNVTRSRIDVNAAKTFIVTVAGELFGPFPIAQQAV